MSKIPLPPDDFGSLDLKDIIVEQQTWYRLNPVIYPNPLYFDRSGSGRFDGPDQGYGILYVGECEYTPFIECYGRVLGKKLITKHDLQQRDLWRIDSIPPLRLLGLWGRGLVRIGADAQITATTDYDISRQWARAIYNHPEQVDGILYRSRLDNNRTCVGIFDRAKPQLNVNNLGCLLDHSTLLGEILDHYGFGLD